MHSALPAPSASSSQQHSPVHPAAVPANQGQAPDDAVQPTAGLSAHAPAQAMLPSAMSAPQTSLAEAPFLTSGLGRADPGSDFASNAVAARLKMPGNDVDNENNDRKTALASAASKRLENIGLVRLAMQGIDVDPGKSDFRLLMFHAIWKGWEATFHMLIVLPGIDINASRGGGNPLLISAVRQSREAIVQTLLAIPGIDVNARDTCGDTALTWAACDGNASIVRALLAMPDIKFDLVDLQGKMRGSRDAGKMERSLAALSAYRRPSVDECAALEGLLQRIFPAHAGPAQTQAFAGADSDAHMLNDACARLRFGECDTAEVPELLRSLSHLPREERLAAAYALAFGASIGCFRDEEGNLDKAIAKALKEMHLLAEYHDSSRMLSNARDNINLYRVGKMNLLCAAAEEGNLPMIRGLVRLGAYVNVPSPNGDTALATAVATRQWAACVELISLGALPTLPDKSGYPMIYHLVSDFCKNVPESEALVGLIRYLIQRGVRFTIPVKNPDEKARAEIPTVLVSDLLCSKAEQWQRYGHLLLGFGGKAPAVALPGRAIDIPASTNTTTTPGIKLVNAFPAAALKRNQGSAGAVAADAASPPDAVSASNIDRMLAADDELASFIAWLGRDARRYRWQDPQSGQGLLHRAVAMGNFEAVRLLLERGLDRRLVDRQGRTPAQLLPASHMRSARLADLLER